MKECMSCGGFLLVFGKHVVPSLFYAKLGGSLGFLLDKSPSLIFGRREKVTVRRLKSLACLYRVINVHLYFHIFIQSAQERMNFEVEALHLSLSPLSPPSLLHSPYLLPLFMRQPSCSALMRGHLKLQGWKEGDEDAEISQHFDKFHHSSY